MTTTLEHPRYRFDRWIAAGGMGEVWAATDTLLDREVAVKVLRREYAEDPVLRARFAAEARHAGSLQHPHVAAVLDYGELEGEDSSSGDPLPFLVMELVEGRPLSALLTGGKPLPPEQAADLVAQAAEGVAAAHRLGIVHRDVKPGNLLVTESGQVKVTDFGVARAADTAPLTLTGHLVGTPYYLAPEQAEGAPATPASDVYALGIVLYECLTGEKPFAGESPVVTALMQIRDPLPALPASIPEPLREIVQVATAKDPHARFATAGALAAALRDQASGTRTFVMPTGATRRAHAAPRRHSRLVPVVAVGAVLALVLGLGWLAFGRDGASPVRNPAGSASSTAPSAAQVRVRASAYVGMQRSEAASRLRALGLRVEAVRQPNPGGGNPAGTVASLAPTGLLDEGDLVTLQVWEAAPPPPKPSEKTKKHQAGSKKHPAKKGSGPGKGGKKPHQGKGEKKHGGGKRGKGGKGGKG